MDLNSLMRSFLSAGGQLHAGTPATGRLDAEGKTTLDLPIPGPGAPAPLYFVAVVLTADGTTVEWVSAFAPLLCLG